MYKIKLKDTYWMSPFSLDEHYDKYMELLNKNLYLLDYLESSQIVDFHNKTLKDSLKLSEADDLLNLVIFDSDKLIGKISLSSTSASSDQYPQLTFFLDSEYMEWQIVSIIFHIFFELAKKLRIKKIIWEIKSTDEIKNYYASKIGFNFWKQYEISTLERKHWKAKYCNVYIKEII